MSQHLLIVSRECSNCQRFLDALSMVKNSGIQAVDYSILTPIQRVGITAVPTLILDNGKRLVGTDCFTWLNERFANVEPDGFDGFDNDDNGLMFSNVESSIGYAQIDRTWAELE